MDTIIYIYVLITMAFSAFFSGMEIAFISIDKLRFEMEKKPGMITSIISRFMRNPNNFISTMLVGNNIALVVYGIFMAQISTQLIQVLIVNILFIYTTIFIHNCVVFYIQQQTKVVRRDTKFNVLINNGGIYNV